jgi:hypothetical protein
LQALFRIAIALVVSASLLACSTTRVIAEGSDASRVALQQSPALGDPRDAVVIVTTDGKRHEMRLTTVTTEVVSGTSLDQKQSIQIPISQVQRVEVFEVNTRAVVIAVVVAVVLAVAIGVSAGNAIGKSLTAAF